MRKLLCAILRSLGIRNIRQADSGKEALEILHAFSADIVITDWEMAPMNGLELTRAPRLGENSLNPCISIIMVTGKTETARVIEARDAGINHLLTKPVSPKALSDRINALIDDPAQFVRTDSYFGPSRRRRSLPLPEGFADRRVSKSGAPTSAELLREKSLFKSS